MHIQVQVGLGHVHCLYCGARKECLVSCVVHHSVDELFDGQQAYLGFVTVTDTQQVEMQGVQLRNTLSRTRGRLASPSGSVQADYPVFVCGRPLQLCAVRFVLSAFNGGNCPSMCLTISSKVNMSCIICAGCGTGSGATNSY